MSLAQYFIGAGDVHVSPLDADGNPTVWRNIGEAPMFEWNPTVEYADNFKTGKTGPNLQDLHTAIKRTAELTLVLKERTAANLALLLHGEDSSENAGTMSTPVDLPTGIQAGDIILLPGDHVGITNLVLKDDAGSPVTLDSDNYTFDGDSKLITFLDVTGLTQPIQVFSYSYKASTSVVLLNETPPAMAVLFDGINLAVPGQKIWARIDRVEFSPATRISMKAGSGGGTANAPDEYELRGPALLKPGADQSDGYGVQRTY